MLTRLRLLVYKNIQVWKQKYLTSILKKSLNLENVIDKKIAIVSLVSGKDFSHYVICLFSFLQFLPTLPQVVVLDDGTLSVFQKKELSEFLPFAILLSLKDTQRFYTLKFPQTKKIIIKSCAEHKLDRKLVDLLYIKENLKVEKALLLDSDVFFFRKPQMINDFFLSDKHRKGTKKNDLLFMKDCKNSYFADMPEIKKFFGYNVISEVNSGLLALNLRILTQKFINEYYIQLAKFPKKLIKIPKYSEQTGFALLASVTRSQALPKEYFLSDKNAGKNLVCKHFVTPIRNQLIDEAFAFEFKKNIP